MIVDGFLLSFPLLDT